MSHKLWFQAGVAIIFTLLIIMLIMEVQEVFSPLVVLVKTIFLPLLLAGVLFYLTRPLFNFLEKRRFPKGAAIFVILFLIVVLIWLFYKLIAPIVTSQINSLVSNEVNIMNTIEQYRQYLLNQRQHLPDFVREQLNNSTNQFSSWASDIGSWLWTFLSGLITGLVALVLAPFFLVYILKDYRKFAPFVAGFFKQKKRTWVRKTLHDVDETLKAYILGQLLVSVTVGCLLLIGYLIIGLNYAVLLAIIGMMTNIIPFLGPFIAVVPAMIIALVQDPIMAVYVAVIMLIAQQIEGNLITPNIMGNALHVHPLTVITVVLAAGNIAGIWGIILAVPFYAVVRTIVTNIYAERKEIEQTATKEV